MIVLNRVVSFHAVLFLSSLPVLTVLHYCLPQSVTFIFFTFPLKVFFKGTAWSN